VDEVGGDAAVHAEEAAVDERGDGEGAKGLDAGVVHTRGVLVQTFALEGEVLGKVSALVVAAKEGELGGVPQLEGVEIEQTLDAETSAIDVVAEEEVRVVDEVTADFGGEELHEVIVLAVDVPADCYWTGYVDEIWLHGEEGGGLVEDEEGLVFCEPALAKEVLLKELAIGLANAGVIERVELIVGWTVDGRFWD
jgi:hypothetical protein